MNLKTKLLPPNASQLLYALEEAEARALALCELRTIQLPFIKHKHHTNFEDLIDFLIWDNGLEEIIFYIRDARTTFGYVELFETARKWKTYQGTIQSFIEAFSWIGYVHYNQDFQNNGNFQIIEFENNGTANFEYDLRFYNALDRGNLFKVKGLAKLATPLRCKLREMEAVNSSETFVNMHSSKQSMYSIKRQIGLVVALISPRLGYWYGEWDGRTWGQNLFKDWYGQWDGRTWGQNLFKDWYGEWNGRIWGQNSSKNWHDYRDGRFSISVGHRQYRQSSWHWHGDRDGRISISVRHRQCIQSLEHWYGEWDERTWSQNLPIDWYGDWNGRTWSQNSLIHWYGDWDETTWGHGVSEYWNADWGARNWEEE